MLSFVVLFGEISQTYHPLRLLNHRVTKGGSPSYTKREEIAE